MQPALFRQRFRAAEAGTGYFPTEPVMLCDPGGTASDDPVPTVVCKHHTEYRGFRHIGTYFPGNTPVSIRTQKILPKARSVEIPYTQNIFLNLRRCGSGGKNRKIPPFTVSAQRQIPRFFRGGTDTPARQSVPVPRTNSSCTGFLSNRSGYHPSRGTECALP